MENVEKCDKKLGPKEGYGNEILSLPGKKYFFCAQALILLPEFLATGKTFKKTDEGSKNPPMFISVAQTLESYTKEKTKYTLNIYFTFPEQES